MTVVHPSTTASEVANLMISEDIGGICVVSPEDGTLVGLIALRNLLQPRAQHRREERVRTRSRRQPI